MLIALIWFKTYGGQRTGFSKQLIYGSVSPSICAVLKCEELVLPWVSCNQVHIQKCDGTGGIWSLPNVHFLKTITRQVTNAMRKLVTLQSSDELMRVGNHFLEIRKDPFSTGMHFWMQNGRPGGMVRTTTPRSEDAPERYELGGGRGNLQWILSVCGYTFYRINIHAVGV